MSLCNVHLTKKAGFVVTDTIAYTTAGQGAFRMSKAIVLPHLRMCIASRGAVAFIVAAFQSFNVANVPEGCIDGVIPKAEGLAERAFEAVAGAIVDIPDFELVLVGWSDAEGCVIGHVLDRKAGVLRQGRIPYDVLAWGPNINGSSHRVAYRKIDPPGTFIDQAKRQRAAMGEGFYDGFPVIGGELVMTEMTRHGASQRVIHRWTEDVITDADSALEAA